MFSIYALVWRDFKAVLSKKKYRIVLPFALKKKKTFMITCIFVRKLKRYIKNQTVVTEAGSVWELGMVKDRWSEEDNFPNIASYTFFTYF